jgi:guanylate kinase
MGRPRKILYKRDGVFYARIQGKRWGTDTSDEKIAYHRALLMDAELKPWEEIRDKYRNQVVITVNPKGYAHAEMISQEVRDDEPVTVITGRIPVLWPFFLKKMLTGHFFCSILPIAII